MNSPRMDLMNTAPKVYKALIAVNSEVVEGPLDPVVRELVKIRASQLNGCVFCVDMHVKGARSEGISDDRLHQLPVWRESPLFTDAEKAALAYTDAATRLGEGGVGDVVWQEVTDHFTPDEHGYLVAQVALINAFNRVAVPLRTQPPTRSA